MTSLDCGKRKVDLDRISIMGILNVTPDSFSDGGKFQNIHAALSYAQEMISAGAGMIDIGGESTRPGAQPIGLQEELDRVIPIIEALRPKTSAVISIDTRKPEVMRAAVYAGADFINDIYALSEPGAVEAAAELGVPVCLMHAQGDPQHMQNKPAYKNVVSEIYAFLEKRIEACITAGIAKNKIVIDPGFGFGKTPQHNFTLLRQLSRFKALGTPILVGLSRKSMIHAALNLPVNERLHASIALALLAAQNGANILRVHDVNATRDAIRMYEAVYRAA